jgi:predicted permease
VTELARGDSGSLLGVLMGAVGMVLLIALANAANLLVARVEHRRRELAVRTALGATRLHLWTHLLVESILLAAGGAVVGLAAAGGGIALLPLVASSYLPRLDEAHLGGHTVAFALILAGVGVLLFTAIPLLHHRLERRRGSALRAGGRTTAAGSWSPGSQRILVGAQLAVVTPLLAGAALLVGSFARLQAVDPGFDAPRLLSLQVHLSPAVWSDASSRRELWDRALERLAALPGVDGAALSTERPPDGVFNVNNFELEDRPTLPGQPERVAPWVVVDPRYFSVLGVPLREGRTFQPSDLDDDAPPVLVVDEAWAEQNYPGESPVGRRLYAGGQSTGPRSTIVGVVASVPYQGVGRSALGAVYQPSRDDFSDPWLMVRTAGDPRDVADDVREVLRRLAPSSPVTDVATGEEMLHDALTRPHHLTVLLGVFSTVALLLAVVGVYGVTSYDVEQRRGAIAVRLALGGPPRAVLATTLRDGLRVALAGLAVGVVAALLVTRVLSGLLYGVRPRDPVALMSASLLLLAVSALACLVPALRAVRVDPAATLRED